VAVLPFTWRPLAYVTIAPYSPKKGQRITQMQYFLQLPSRTSENSVYANFRETRLAEVR
jgi:hypothetical protein